MSELGPSAELRAVILGAAQQMFAEKGFRKTTMGDLAEASGSSPANLYNYFPNKKAIGFAVVGLYLDELNGRLAALERAPPTDPRAHLCAHIRIRAHHLIEHLRARPLLIELAEMVHEEQEGAAVVEQYLRAELDALRAIIERGTADGVFRVADAATAAWAAHLATRYFLTPRALAVVGLDTAETDLELVLDLVLRGLSTPSP